MFPTLQRRIYNALKEMTPNEVGFLLSDDFEDYKFNPDFLDYDSHHIVSHLLYRRFNDRYLMLTNDDIYCTWQRITELLYLYEGVRQGILEEKSGKDGGSVYEVKGTKPSGRLSKKLPKKKVFETHKDPYYYRVTFRR